MKSKNLYPVTVNTSEIMRKRQIAKSIKTDINYLFENPSKLKKFREHLNILKEAMEKQKEREQTQDHVQRNIELSKQGRI